MPVLSRLHNKPITECTPQELRTAASACRAQVEESFQRSDTDGSLSQWAGSMTSQLYELQAKINEAGGSAEFRALLDADDNLVSSQYSAEYKTFPNGARVFVREWALTPAQRRQYGRFAIPAGKRSRVQKQLGLHEGKVRLPAFAGMGGSGTGLSGVASAFVTAFPMTEAEADARHIK